MQGIADEAAEKLRVAGLLAASKVHEGAAVAVLLKEARTWGADCIILGVRGDIVSWSVSSAVSARAGCSVEVIRIPEMAAENIARDDGE